MQGVFLGVTNPSHETSQRSLDCGMLCLHLQMAQNPIFCVALGSLDVLEVALEVSYECSCVGICGYQLNQWMISVRGWVDPLLW